MFEHFTRTARDAVVGSQETAARLGHPAIGTVHLLLAVTDRPGRVADALAGNGVTAVSVERELTALLDGGDYRTGLRLLSRRHDVVPVVISDPTERSGRSMGLAEFVDMETGRRVLTETFPSAVPAPDLKGFETIELGTDLPAGGAVLDFLRKRGRARRPGRGPE